LKGRVEITGDVVSPIEVLAMRVDELRSVTLRAGSSEAGVRGDVAIVATRLQGMHADPADRLIAATALVMNATLLTADAAILGMKTGPSRLDART
jgi:PIN domain nuclease of toxin-antitoxin system